MYPQPGKAIDIGIIAVVINGAGAVLLQMAAHQRDTLWVAPAQSAGRISQKFVLAWSLVFVNLPASVFIAQVKPTDAISAQILASLFGLALVASNVWWIHYLYVRRWTARPKEVVLISTMLLLW